mgnify:CR=1 FL=1
MKDNKLSTKDRLLDSAYKEIYKYGFQGCSVDRILKDAKVPKGSMYHHYKSKKELALGVISERITPAMLIFFSFENTQGNDELDQLENKIIEMSELELSLKFGCPMNKLVREMFSLDEEFKKLLDDTYKKILSKIELFLEQAIQNKTIEKCDTKSLALFIYTTIIGNISVGEGNITKESFLSSTSHLFNYLHSLKSK